VPFFAELAGRSRRAFCRLARYSGRLAHHAVSSSMYGSGEETLYSLLTCLSETPLELVNNLSRRVAEVRADHFGHEGRVQGFVSDIGHHKWKYLYIGWRGSETTLYILVRCRSLGGPSQIRAEHLVKTGSVQASRSGVPARSRISEIPRGSSRTVSQKISSISKSRGYMQKVLESILSISV